MRKHLVMSAVVLALVLTFSLLSMAAADADVDVVERETAEAAFAAADKGNPDPAWRGKRFTVATLAAGPRGALSGPLYFWRPYFEQLTGATYDIAEIPFAEFQAKVLTDMATGQGTYDAIIGPMFLMGDYLANDWIIPIDKYFDDPRMPKWDRDSIAEPIKALYMFGDSWYAFNNDHDGMVLYYRRDILSDPKWQAEFEAERGYPMPTSLHLG